MDGIPRLNIQYPDYGNVLARGAAIKGQEARNALTRVQLRDYPEERNWLKKKRGWEETDRETRIKREDLDREIKILKIGTSYLGRVENIVDYVPYRQFMIEKFGVNPEILPEPETFGGDEEAFDQFRDRATLSAKERILLNKAKIGDKITISKILPDGRVQEREIDPKEFMVNREKYPGYEYGEIKGTRTPKEKPDKTERLYETAEGWKTRAGAIGKKKPSKDKPEVKESAAIDKIVNIRKAIAKFDETGLIDAWIMKNEPELAKTLNKATSPEDKEVALDAMRKQAIYYMGFLSDANKKIFGNDNDPLGIR